MASVRRQSTEFVDALSGRNGMADPAPAPLKFEVMADPTASSSVVDAPDSSIGLTPPVRPGPRSASPPPPTGPAFAVPPPLFTARAVPRTAATRPAPPPGMRTGPPAVRRPAGSYAPTPYAQPFAPPAGRSVPRPPQPIAAPARPGLPGQLTALQAQLRQQAAANRGRRPPKRKKTSWGGVFVLLVFVFLFLVGSGLFAKILDAVQQVLHR